MIRSRPLWSAAVLIAIGACTLTETPVQSSEPSTTAPSSIPRSEIPDVELNMHSVPLDEILFDTFDGGTVPLSASTPELRARLLDAIPPLDHPGYQGPAGGDWLLPDDLVLGYVAEGEAYAYPFKILNFHEIVNDHLGGVPVLISYCPLCRSAIVYDRRLEDTILEFSNTSALYESDLVMVDRNTGSYWWQVAGEAIVGPLTGSRLTPLASSVATWQEWRSLHPDTRILSMDTGFARPYEQDPFTALPDRIDAGAFPFPVGETARDNRLAPSTMVLGVVIAGQHRVYPISTIGEVVNDVIAGTPIVVFVTGDGESSGVFSPVVGDIVLRFSPAGEGFVDDTTGSTWTGTGRAVSGELAGTQLRPLPSRTTFWFAYVAAFPEVEVFEP